MSITCEWARASRSEEISGCPLLTPEREPDEAPCARCPYNVVSPGRARLGCRMVLQKGDVERTLSRLRTVSAAAADKLETMLLSQGDAGLSGPELEELVSSLRHFWDVASSDAAERQVLSVLITFAEAGVKRREPVRLLA